MCGRGRQTAASAQAIAEALNIPMVEAQDEYVPLGNNGAPGHVCPLFVSAAEHERAQHIQAHWGLVPAYQKPTSRPDFWRMFNARDDNLENIHSRLLQRKRCVVPLEGFYEWTTGHSKKKRVPYYLSAKECSQMGLAGVWDVWVDAEGRHTKSFAIVTVPPCEDLLWMHHDRMPAVLRTSEEILEWLNPELKFSQVKHLLRPCSNGFLQWWPCNDKIGKVAYQQDENCWKPVVVGKQQQTRPITSFFSPHAKHPIQDEEERDAKRGKQ